MENPYRRAFLLATAENEKSLDNAMLEQVSEHLPNFLLKLIDGLGVALVNINLPKNKKIKHIFQMKSGKRHGHVFRVPDPKTGKMITVETD